MKLQQEYDELVIKNEKEVGKVKRKLIDSKLQIHQDGLKWQRRLKKVEADLERASDRAYAQKKKSRNKLNEMVTKAKGEPSLILH